MSPQAKRRRYSIANVCRRRKLKLLFRALVAALICCLNFGCGIVPHAIPNVRKNIVMINAKGEPADPTGNFDCNRSSEGWCNGLHTALHDYEKIEQNLYAQHLEELTNDIVFRIPEPDSPKKVLIFVHGGLNTQVETVERAARLRGEIEKEGYYPIFINWQSSLLTSYKNHLLHIRQGEYWGNSVEGGVWGWLTAPFYLIGDIARSIARAPVVIGMMLRSDIQSNPDMRPLYGDDFKNAEGIAKKRFCEYNATAHDSEFPEDICPTSLVPMTPPIPIWFGADRRSYEDKLVAGGKYLITFPVKLAISPILDAGGSSSWDSMLRARSMLFHIERDGSKEAEKPECGEPNLPQDGAILKLMQQLRFLQYCKGVKFDITLIGHSMGTFVVNEIIRRFDDLPFNRIIYMAAAAPIHDYEDSIFPYLLKKQDEKQDVRVYHLTLHPVSEVREAWDEYTLGIDFPPRGSLLVWIDNFLADPMNRQDRAVGRFTNLMLALHHTPPKIAQRIHVKIFRAGDPSESPLKHSHFTSPFHFWESKCWEPQYNPTVFKDCMNPLDSNL